MSFPVLNLICTTFMFVFLHFFWKFASRVWDDTSKYMRRWEKNPDIKPRTGFYGRVVMWNVRKSLENRYKQFPQVGDLLQHVGNDKIFIVTHRYEPKPISPFGYVDLQSMDEGSNKSERIMVNNYYKDSYEKVTPEDDY